VSSIRRKAWGQIFSQDHRRHEERLKSSHFIGVSNAKIGSRPNGDGFRIWRAL
jgi:hypothetical protein